MNCDAVHDLPAEMLLEWTFESCIEKNLKLILTPTPVRISVPPCKVAIFLPPKILREGHVLTSALSPAAVSCSSSLSSHFRAMLSSIDSRRMLSPLLSTYPWTTGAMSKEDIRTIVDSQHEMAVRLILKNWASIISSHF